MQLIRKTSCTVGFPGYRNLLVCFFFFIQVSPVSSQSYFLTDYSKRAFFKNGVDAIFESPKGYMWIAGRLGLVRYCGNDNAKVYERRDGGSIVTFAAIEDSYAVVWLCTPEGLFYTRGNHLEKFRFSDSLVTNQRFNRIFEDSGKNIWVLSKNSLYQLQRTSTWFSFRRIKIKEELGGIGETPGGKIWVGTATGISEVSGDSLIPVIKTAGINGHSGRVKAIYKDAENRLFFVDNYLNEVIKNDKFREVVRLTDNGSNPIITHFYDSTLAFATYGDTIKIFTSGKLSYSFSGAALNLNRWRCVRVDKEGNIWAGLEAGLVRFTPDKIKKLPQIPEGAGLDPASITAIKPLSESEVLLATQKYQFAKYSLKDGKLDPYFFGNSVSDNISGIRVEGVSPRDIYIRNDTAYIFNNLYEVFGIDMKSKAAFSFKKDIDNFKEIYSYYPEGDKIWVAGAGVFGKIVNGQIHYINSTFIKDNYLRGLGKLEHCDSLFIGSQKGLLYASGDKIGAVDGLPWPPENRINTLINISDSSILLFVDGMGIYSMSCLGKLKFRPVLTRENSHYDFKYLFGFYNAAGRILVKLSSSPLFSLLENIAGKYFLRPLSHPAYMEQKLLFGFDISADADNTLYWINNKNFYTLDLSGKDCFQQEHQLYITDIRVSHLNDNAVAANSGTDRILLGSNQNTISFNFSEIDFHTTTPKTYEYYLDGYKERPFINITTSNEAIYRNLPAGNYTFHVRSRDNYDKQGNLVEAVFHFRVLPPWYQTWWAYLLWLLTGAVIILGLVRWRVNIVRKKESIKRMLVDNELKALRAQINPHFIQNTFDLMAHGIHKGNTGESINIIHKVSAYLRQVLYKSEKSTISLEDELEYTEDYLKMQQMVRPGLFEYRLHIGDEVDTFGIRVPSMLVQPIVENCIKHGFRHIRSGGMIEITVRQSGGKLHFQIKDNGTGIAGKEIDPENSKGLQLTYKRLMLMFPAGLQKKLEVSLKNRADGIAGAEYNILMPLAF